MISRWVSQLLDECIVQITVQEQNGRLSLLPVLPLMLLPLPQPGPGQNKAKKTGYQSSLQVFFPLDEETGEVLKRTSLIK